MYDFSFLYVDYGTTRNKRIQVSPILKSFLKFINEKKRKKFILYSGNDSMMDTLNVGVGVL